MCRLHIFRVRPGPNWVCVIAAQNPLNSGDFEETLALAPEGKDGDYFGQDQRKIYASTQDLVLDAKSRATRRFHWPLQK